MMRRIPAATRLLSLSIAITVSLPALADIDLVGNPTLFSTSDVTLTDHAELSGMMITEHTLNGPSIFLNGDGNVSLGGKINTDNLFITTSEQNNTSLNADGTGFPSPYDDDPPGPTLPTQINANNLYLDSSYDYQASLNLSNGASATISNYLNIHGQNSVVNLDNASLTTYNLRNEGTINISGSNGSLHIMNNNGYSSEPLSRINVSNGAQFNLEYFFLRKDDLITATNVDTQINTWMTSIDDTTLQLNNGAVLNSSYIMLYAGGSAGQNATLNADGTGLPKDDPYALPVPTQINAYNLTLNSWNGQQASLNLSDGATATINNELLINGADSVVNLDNASLTTNTLHNEGTINVAGAASSLQINNNSYSGEPLGKINFSEGAQFNQNDLFLQNGDLITASNVGTQINTSMTNIEGTTLQLNNGATLNAQDIWIFASDSTQGNSAINADGSGIPNNDPYDPSVPTQINTNYLSLNSWDGYQASLNLSNGATATINNELQINGADSVVNLDNASLTTNTLHNEGTINVAGAASSLQINNNSYSGEPLGKINFSEGAQFNKNDLNLRNGDLITATDAGTQINTFMTGIEATTLQLNNGATLNSNDIWLMAGAWTGGNATLNADGAGIPANDDDALPVPTQINTNYLNLNSWDGYQASLNLSNGATATINSELRINGADSVVNLDNASLITNTMHNEGTINVAGAAGSLQINNNNYGEPLGKINFSNGAQFNQEYLFLRNGDLITATDGGTQINTWMTNIEGTNLQLNNGAALNSDYISLMAGAWTGGNATLNADGAGVPANDPYDPPVPTQINTNYLNLNSWDGYQASFNLSNGATATINNELRINGADSVVNIDNASLITNTLRNEGTINVAGAASSLQINNNYYGEPLGKINFSEGAQFNQNDLNLRNGDLITATDAGTQIYSSFTNIESTTLQLNDGATLNTQDIYLFASDWAGGDANLYADDTNTHISTNNLSLHSLEGHQASLHIINGASANINNQLDIYGQESVVNLNNATLTTDRLHNEGTINVAGANSALTISDSGYSGDPLGRINFSEGAQFTKDNILLRNGDVISATGAGTQINSSLTNIESTTLQLNDGATLNTQDIYVFASDWAGGNASLNTEGSRTQINTNNLNVYSNDGHQASLNLSNGTSATIDSQLNIMGTNSVVNIDNSLLHTGNINNEGTINIEGNDSWLDITSNAYYSTSSIGHINLSKGSYLTNYQMQLHQNDVITATDIGTKLYISNLDVNSTSLYISNEAILDSFNLTITANYSPESNENNVAKTSNINADGIGTKINTFYLSIFSEDDSSARLNLTNGASTTVAADINIYGQNSVVSLDNAYLNANSMFTEGKIISTGISEITGQIENNGVIDITDQLTISGDLYMRSGSSLVFNFGGDPLNEFGTLVLNGNLWSNDPIAIRFDGKEYIENLYAYSIDLIVATSFLPDIGMFNIDMSAFNFLGDNWNRSVSVDGNRLVLSVTSAVPVPASLWLMMSALTSLVALNRRKHLRR